MASQKRETATAEYLDATDAAIYLGLSPNTLARWRCEKANLPYHKIGGAIRYKRSDLDAFAETHRVSVSGSDIA